MWNWLKNNYGISPQTLNYGDKKDILYKTKSLHFQTVDTMWVLILYEGVSCFDKLRQSWI